MLKRLTKHTLNNYLNDVCDPETDACGPDYDTDCMPECGPEDGSDDPYD